MQKAPNYSFHIRPMNLPEDFPFSVSGIYTQKDEEITRLHIHETLELGYCYQGSGIFVVENKVLPFSQGDISIISSSEMHLAQSTQGTTSKWRWIYADIQRLLFPVFKDPKLVDISPFSGTGFQNIISAKDHPRVCRKVLDLIETYLKKSKFWKNEIVSILCLFISHLHNSMSVREINREPKYESDTLERIQKAIVYITNNYHQPVNLEDLASLCYLSPNHFRRLFRQAIGKSPIQYLHHVRITMASTELLHSRKPIGLIAQDCGFYSLSSFNRQFKTQTGISPREFRGR